MPPTSRTRIAVAVAAALVPGWAGQAAGQVAGQAPSGYTLPGTQTFDMASDDGQTYRIFLSTPVQPAPPGGFPVLYVLDGNALFAGFAGERRLEEYAKKAGGGVVVVGIGYPTDQAYDLPRRLYDLTPPWSGAPPAAAPAPRTGGNERFARFLIDRLRPEIARRLPVAANRQSLFGHSLGGLFALHMLYTRPTAFEAIVAASPSQWWNDQAILAEERAFAQRLAGGRIAAPVARLLLVSGDRDDTATITWDVQALARRLDRLSADGLRTRLAIVEGEEHITVPYRAITPTLRFVNGVP